jgi:hypothetical protein
MKQVYRSEPGDQTLKKIIEHFSKHTDWTKDAIISKVKELGLDIFVGSRMVVIAISNVEVLVIPSGFYLSEFEILKLFYVHKLLHALYPYTFPDWIQLINLGKPTFYITSIIKQRIIPATEEVVKLEKVTEAQEYVRNTLGLYITNAGDNKPDNFITDQSGNVFLVDNFFVVERLNTFNPEIKQKFIQHLIDTKADEVHIAEITNLLDKVEELYFFLNEDLMRFIRVELNNYQEHERLQVLESIAASRNIELSDESKRIILADI